MMAEQITHYRRRRKWEQVMLNALEEIQRPYDGPARSAERP